VLESRNEEQALAKDWISAPSAQSIPCQARSILSTLKIVTLGQSEKNEVLMNFEYIHCGKFSDLPVLQQYPVTAPRQLIYHRNSGDTILNINPLIQIRV
jgi:hypothetical protein